MCGIFAYTGNKTAQPILLKGLQTLEYRGYDSAGIYLPEGGVIKSVGPIANLAEKLPEKSFATSGIAHTRWATHGEPTEENAHPHCDVSEKLWIVHNGIIDNWEEIKEGLRQQGIRFYSDTDSEVLAKLIGLHYKNNLTEAIKLALTYVQGTFGLVVLHEDFPEELHVARSGSPLVIGVGDGEYFVSSDPSALIVYTHDVIYLEEDEYACITPRGYTVTQIHDSKEIAKQHDKIEWTIDEVQKDGYEHFMLKEIHEAPTVVENTLRGRLLKETGKVKLGGLEAYLPQLNAVERLDIIGCGSAYYAGAVGEYLLSNYADLFSTSSIASEYRFRKPHYTANSALLAVSQSGETADTLQAIKEAKKADIHAFGVVNVVGSSIARETDAGIYNHAGPEIAVASTKAFISQLTVMSLLTLFFGRERTMNAEEGKEIVQELIKLPEYIEEILAKEDEIKQYAQWICKYDSTIFLGRNTHAPIAAEGALKLKEVSYIHAEAYPFGELKHGPLALLDENMPVVALTPNDDLFKKNLANLQEVKARKSPLLVIASGTNGLSNLTDKIFTIPKTHPVVQPIISTVPLHLLAYYAGVYKDLNVDKPKNLAKSVTVE